MVFDVISTVRHPDDRIDYDTVIFIAQAANVLDLDSADGLWYFGRALINGGAKKLAVDMDGLEFIDSAGIGVLINLTKLVRQKKGDLVLLNVPNRIEKIFEPIKLNRFIRFFSGIEDMVNFFRLV